jgi:hypothetical protein
LPGQVLSIEGLDGSDRGFARSILNRWASVAAVVSISERLSIRRFALPKSLCFIRVLARFAFVPTFSVTLKPDELLIAVVALLAKRAISCGAVTEVV